VANEYSLYSESAQAKALGDRLCAEGAVGTGNGRTVTFCGQRAAEVPKAYGSAALAVGVIAIALGATVYMQNDYTSVRTSNEEGVGMRYDTDGKVFLTYKLRW